MKTVRTIAELRRALEEARNRGARIGLVPTMGAFHDGHVALMQAAREACEVVVVSLFVNPAQFGSEADLASYPRDEARDAGIAADVRVDLLFAPAAAEIYPPGFDTWVEPGAIGQGLEGAARPGHFRGVATICTKLFDIVQPRIAFFGRKDAQQVAVIRQVARDLDLGVEIAAIPTVRDAEGLALSSRNALLDPAERQRAVALSKALGAGADAHRSGGDGVAAARGVLAGTPALDIDYVEIVDLDGPTLAAAVRIGSVRLIDNVRLESAESR